MTPEHPAARGFARWIDQHRYPWGVLPDAARAALWRRYVQEREQEAQHAA